MTSKNSKPGEIVLLLVSLLITAGMLGVLWFWLYPRMVSQWTQPDETLSSSPPPVELDSELVHRFSTGERQLITMVTTLAKQEGIAAFAAGDYQKAAEWFEESLQITPNDPETLIYLNNARVRQASFRTATIAVSVPIGKNLDVAQEILRGVAQAQHEMLQAGGFPIGLEVEIINDDNNPNLTRLIAQVLVEAENVLAVVGHNTSDASLAAAPIYQEQGLVMISPTTFNPEVSRIGNYIFRAVPTAQSMATALANHLAQRLSQSPRVLVCYDFAAPDNAVFRDAFVDMLTANGGEVVSVVNESGDDLCNFASHDFDADEAIDRAIAQGANSLYLGPSINYLDPAIEVAQANAGRLPLFSSPSLYTQKIIQDGQDAVEGLVLIAPWSPNAYPAFAQRARTLWRATVNWRTATAYDAARAVIAGLQQSHSRDGLQQTLQKPDFSTSGSGDEVRFLDTRDRRLTPILIQVEPDGSSGYRFISIDSPVR